MAISVCLNHFVQAFEALDLKGIMECFSQDATSFFPVHHYPHKINDKAEITEQFRNVISKIKEAGLTRISLPVQDLDIFEFGEVALATFHIMDNDLSRRTIVLKKENGTWLITHLHASNAPLEDTE